MCLQLLLKEHHYSLSWQLVEILIGSYENGNRRNTRHVARDATQQTQFSTFVDAFRCAYLHMAAASQPKSKQTKEMCLSLRLDDEKGRCQNHEEQTFVEMFRPTTNINEGIQKQ